MTRKTIHTLVAIVVGLVLLLVVLRSNDLDDKAAAGQRLLPAFGAVANDVTEIQLLRAADDEGITIRRKDAEWVVLERDDYAADVGTLRQLIVALAEAEILEEKTSNPDLYDKLGVDDPAKAGNGRKIVVTGPDFSYAVILGDVAQGDNRYARIVDEPVSYLIDQNPALPETPGDWLSPDIIDIDASRVQRAVISHADGERIVIERSDREQTDFDVLDVPDGRELSYATVGNGIAGALGKLSLEDVRRQVDAPATATAIFETWDGLKVSARIVTDDDTSWIAFSAEWIDDESGAGDRVAEINERHSGWQYRLADYKKNLLTRRWDDVLKE